MSAARPDAAWRTVRRLLVVRLDNLGDVLMTTPALGALRQFLPQAHITLLASASGAALAPHLADVDETIAFDAPWVAKASAADGDDDIVASVAEVSAVQELAGRGFDGAVIFTVCTQSALPAALMCRWAGIGLRLAHSRENPYRLLTHFVRDREQVGDGMRHEVQRQLDLVATIGARSVSTRDRALRFHRRAADDAALQQRLQGLGIDATEPLVVVHPGATAPSRRWPPERFGHAARLVARQCRCRIVFAGGAADADDVARAAAQVPGAVTGLVGALGLGELAALLARAQLVLCNNSAPAHLAAAVGTPVVVAYALTNPQHTPWQVPSRVLSHDVPCRNCLASVCPLGHHACLRGVGADAMADAALELMREQAAA